MPVFFSAEDRQFYLSLLAEFAERSRTKCLAWCLMDNHVHLILVPQNADGLRSMLGEAHRRYTRAINLREEWHGHLFQARFASYPMDDAHLMIAVRYVEQNPVAAGLVAVATDWRWSSARSHVAGKSTEDDPLTNVGALVDHIPNWRAMLCLDVETADLTPSVEAAALAIETRLNTGRPLAAAPWIVEQEARLGRHLAPQRPGPKPTQRKAEKLIELLSPNP